MGRTKTDGRADPRFARLTATMKKHRFRQDALIEVLRAAQESFDFLSVDVMRFIAISLRLPPSHVYGVATFYHLFSFEPKGRHDCVVCLGTTCYFKGGSKLASVAEQMANVRPGGTTIGGSLSYRTARCFGACGMAPAAIFDGDVVGFQSPESVAAFVKRSLDDRE